MNPYLKAKRTKYAAIKTELEGILTRAADDGREALTEEENTKVRTLTADGEKLYAEVEELTKIETRHRAMDELAGNLLGGDEDAQSLAGGAPAGGSQHERTRNPLAYTAEALDSLDAAIHARASGRFDHDMKLRAALTTGTYGAPRVWSSNVTEGPRLLHVAAGIPSETGVAAILAQFPAFTLPTATGSVGENVTLSEYDDSTAGSLTMARFGRFTDKSRESGIGTNTEQLIAMHQLGIALDLDKVLIDAVEAAAGAAVAFAADVPAQIRKALARVQAATAAPDVSRLVVLVHPDNADLLQDVAPISGSTIAEGFQRFSGALVYPSNAVNTGFITVANLLAAVRYFEAAGVATATDEDVKTGTQTTATSTIAGYGIGLVGGFASMVDVIA